MNIIRSGQFRAPPSRRRRGAILALLILVLALGGFFFLRSPVLVISDAGFDLIYGFRRSLTGQLGLSLRLFRRVERVLITENADPEALIFALEEKEKRPWAVLGHSRYARGLEQYARQRADVRVTVIGEGPGPSWSGETPPGGLEYVYTDAGLNSWRLGRCAALLAGEAGGLVLIFQDRPDFPVEPGAFLAGLRAESGNLDPVFADPAADYPSWDEVRAVVLGGPAASFPGLRGRQIPVLLYSWLDPALSPSNVKLGGDDSIWALAFEALRLPPGGGSSPRTVPAALSLIRGRTAGAGLRGRLKKALDSSLP
jgi:hypothetical protein